MWEKSVRKHENNAASIGARVGADTRWIDIGKMLTSGLIKAE